MEQIKKISDCSIFRGVAEETLREVHRRLTSRPIAKGEYLYRMGDKPKEIHFVTFGKFYCSIPDAEGKEYFCELVSGGHHIGVHETLASFHYFTDCYAVAASHVQTLSIADFQLLFRADPVLSQNVSRMMSCHTLAAQIRRFQETLPLDFQLAKLIIDLAARFGDQYLDGIRIGMHLTHDELAFLVHTSRQTISKIINRWRELGWIEHSYGNVVVTDIDSLMRYCRTFGVDTFEPGLPPKRCHNATRGSEFSLAV